MAGLYDRARHVPTDPPGGACTPWRISPLTSVRTKYGSCASRSAVKTISSGVMMVASSPRDVVPATQTNSSTDSSNPSVMSRGRPRKLPSGPQATTIRSHLSASYPGFFCAR